MKISTSGLIIRERHIGESDRLITILTADRGIIHAFATGARSVKGKRQSATQLLSYSNFILTLKKDTYRVSEAECLDVFFRIRLDITKVALAQYCCELCSAVVMEHDDSLLSLRLILNVLKFLETDRLPVIQLKSIFEVALLSIAGYMPNLSGCAHCEAMEPPMFFDPIEGTLFCGKHRTQSAIAISDGVQKAMLHVATSPLEKIFSFTLSKEGLEEFQNISEVFATSQLERSFKTLEFYHSTL